MTGYSKYRVPLVTSIPAAVFARRIDTQPSRLKKEKRKYPVKLSKLTSQANQSGRSCVARRYVVFVSSNLVVS